MSLELSRVPSFEILATMHSSRERAIVDDVCCYMFVRRAYVPLCFVCVCVFTYMVVLLDSYGDRGCTLVFKGTPVARGEPRCYFPLLRQVMSLPSCLHRLRALPPPLPPHVKRFRPHSAQLRAPDAAHRR